jgi:hypothetical protein
VTSLTPHREEQVRTRKESDRARDTHQLEIASGGTSQDTETNKPSEGYSHSGDRIRRDKSGHGKNPTERGALTFWRPHSEGQVSTRKETDRARGTQVRTWKETNRLRDTLFLETASGAQVRTRKETDRARVTHILETASGGQVRTRRETDRAMGTHFLETVSGGTSQDTEIKG